MPVENSATASHSNGRYDIFWSSVAPAARNSVMSLSNPDRAELGKRKMCKVVEMTRCLCSCGQPLRRLDAVVVDLPVDGGAGHAERLGGPALVPVVGDQAADDGVTFERLELAETAA